MKIKILLWGQDPLYFGIAHNLEKMLDCELYAIFDTTNKPKKFFLKQKLVKFEKIWFYHDNIKKNHPVDIDYLQKFEKKYNINLWKLAINERIFYKFNDFHHFSSEEILSIEEDICKLFETILDEVKPDYLISYVPNLHHQEILFQLCNAKGIKTLILSNPILGYKTRLSESRKIENSTKRNNQSNFSGRSFQEMRNYLDSFDNFKQLKTSFNKKSNTNFIKSAFEYIFSSDNSHEKSHYSYFGRTKIHVLQYMIKLYFHKTKRKKFIEKNFFKEINLKQPYVYFPLGVEPEANILLNAPFFTNQIETIRIIAKSLPVGYQLYVKENPGQVTREWREISEYQKIMDIPNVKLLHPSFSNKKLLENSSIVITVGGSSGFEAAFYEKPSMVFSDTIYTLLPSVYRIKELDQIPERMQKCLSEKVCEQDLDEFLNLLEEETFDFDLRGFYSKIHDYFFLGGTLHDREISEQQMSDFLKNENESLVTITSEYIKKLKSRKE